MFVCSAAVPILGECLMHSFGFHFLFCLISEHRSTMAVQYCKDILFFFPPFPSFLFLVLTPNACRGKFFLCGYYSHHRYCAHQMLVCLKETSGVTFQEV